MFSVSWPEMLMFLMLFILVMAVCIGDYAVPLVALFFACLYMCLAPDGVVESLIAVVWKKVQAISAKLFIHAEELILVLATVAVGVTVFHLLTWLFNYAYEKTYEEEYQERHRYYQYQREQREYRREYHREEPQDDDYSVLGLSPGVTLAEVKAAYRRLVKKYHPDAGGDPEMFKRIHIAYQNIVTGRC